MRRSYPSNQPPPPPNGEQESGRGSARRGALAAGVGSVVVLATAILGVFVGRQLTVVTSNASNSSVMATTRYSAAESGPDTTVDPTATSATDLADATDAATAASVASASSSAPPVTIGDVATTDTTAVQMPTRRTIGTSVEGLPIDMASHGTGLQDVLIIGALHGDAHAMSSVAQRLNLRLEEMTAEWPTSDAAVHVIVTANPDGASANTRENANGVDLNRNFPTNDFRASEEHGTSPLSEPESAAIAGLIEELRPSLIVVGLGTIHESFVNYDGSDESMGRRLASASGLTYRSTDALEATPGSIGSWQGREIGTDVAFIALNESADLEITSEALLRFLVNEFSFEPRGG